MELGARFVPAAVFGLAVACSAASEPTASQRAPIISGTASDPSQDFVVFVVHYDAGYFDYCTGSLLAPNLVLTARHCVSNLDTTAVLCDGNGNSISGGGNILGDFPPSSLSVYYGATRADANTATPDAKAIALYHDNATNLCNHDLALILLDHAIPNAVIAQIRLDSPPVVNEETIAVGFGLTNNSTFPTVRQQRQNVPIKIVGPFPGDLYMPAVAPNDFVVGESICSGDSGGPSLDMTTGAILGVVSTGGNSQPYDPNNPAAECINATNYYTRVDGFVDVINQACADAGQDPWLEGGPDPRLAKFGGACATGADCQSGLCLSSGTCTQDCTADPTSCPSGYACTAISGSAQSQCTKAVPASGCSSAGAGTSGGATFIIAGVAVVAVLKRRKS